MGQAVQPAPAANQFHHERRRPEETTLYQLVQEYLETFLAHVEAETGASLPGFVKDEFDAFLECGNCQNCGGRLQIIAALVDPAVIAKILAHLRWPARAPPRSPARRVDLFQAA
jgi:hypothetical protein